MSFLFHILSSVCVKTPSSVFLQGFSFVKVQDAEWSVMGQKGHQTPGFSCLCNVTNATKSDIALRHAFGDLDKRSICKTHARVLQLCSASSMDPDVGQKVMEQKVKLFTHLKAHPVGKDGGTGIAQCRYNTENKRVPASREIVS